MALAEAIASQQLSIKAADTIFERFCDLFAPDRVPDAARLLHLGDEAVRGAGFSRSKVLFLRDLATHVTERRLALETLHEQPDEAVIASLTAVKGIGRWTAEIFLLFRLRRPDVFPADDLGLVKATERLLGLGQRPSRERLLDIAERWRPYRSIAAWYLWKSLALPPDGTAPRGTTRRPATTPAASSPRRTRRAPESP
jgi:DNA-3-methyladenine glycosylase II